MYYTTFFARKVMESNRLRNKSEYEAALAQIESLMDAEPNSPQEKELERLAILVEAYEDEHFPIHAPDPAEALQFRLEQQGQKKDGKP
jgi:HTH-type transcriptional regulator/antitoxin HigA